MERLINCLKKIDGSLAIWLVGFFFLALVFLFTGEAQLWERLFLVGFLLLMGIVMIIVTPMVDNAARRDADESFYQITGIRPDEDDDE